MTKAIASNTQRSAIMRAVKSKDTKPEMIVRRMVHAMGYRYRLHGRELSGKPDLVFAGRRKVIFVHGCFWHGHNCSRGARQPKANGEYWKAKIARNAQRDMANAIVLQKNNWQVMTVWECETRLSERKLLEQRLREFLG